MDEARAPAGIGAARAPVLSPVDRVSEMLFGLFMALTFVGAVSVAESGQGQVRAMFIAALGCNLAWGLVDAVMYLVRTLADRGRNLSLLHAVRAAATPAAGRALIVGAMAREAAIVIGPDEVESLRARMVAWPDVPARPRLRAADLAAAAAIFVIVVLATFPVVLPFVFFADVRLGKDVSHGLALAMLFGGGLALGRYAGFGSARSGLAMAGLGTLLVVAIRALGG